jgi:SsrA-binding protein
VSKPQDPGERVLATNRKALFNYEVFERAEAGIVLVGTEVKSIREGGLHFRDAYVDRRGNELFLVGCRIGPYSHGNSSFTGARSTSSRARSRRRASPSSRCAPT